MKIFILFVIIITILVILYFLLKKKKNSTEESTTTTTYGPTTTTTTTDGVLPVEICTQLEITIAPEDIADSTDNTLFDNGTVYLEYTDCDEIEQTVKYTVAGTYYVCAWEMAQVTLHHYRGNLDKLGDSSWYNTEILCPVSSNTTTTTTTSMCTGVIHLSNLSGNIVVGANEVCGVTVGGDDIDISPATPWPLTTGDIIVGTCLPGIQTIVVKVASGTDEGSSITVIDSEGTSTCQTYTGVADYTFTDIVIDCQTAVQVYIVSSPCGPVSSNTTTTTTTSTPRTLSWSYNTQIGNYNDFLEINVNGVTKVITSDTGSSSITVHDGDYINASSHIPCSGDLTYAYIEYTMLPDAGDDEATCPDQTASVYFTVSNDVNVSACTGIGECGVI